MKQPIMPHGRYWIIRGGLWHMANSDLDKSERTGAVKHLMTGRADVAVTISSANSDAEEKQFSRTKPTLEDRMRRHQLFSGSRP